MNAMLADPLDAARAVLPGWVAWGTTILYPVGTLLATWLASTIVVALLARPLRRTPDAHWTERARRLHTIRQSLLLCHVMVLVTAWILAFAFPSPVAPWSPAWIVLLTILAAEVGPRLVARRWWSPLGSELAQRRRGVFAAQRMWLILGSPVLIAVLLGLFVPTSLDAASIAAAGALTAVGLFVMTGRVVRVLARFGSVRRVRIEELGIQAVGDSEVLGANRTVYVFDDLSANAIAYPLLGDIAVTKHAIQLLTPGELAAVLRHEAGHLAEPQPHRLWRLLPGLLLLLDGWWRPLHARFGPDFVYALFVTTILAILVTNAAARRAERKADQFAKPSDADDSTYAHALEKLHEWNLVPAVTAPTAIHPSLYDRMIAAGVTPAWPRPRPPDRAPLLLLVALVMLASCAMIVPQRMREHLLLEPQNRWNALVELAVLGGGHTNLAWLAWHANNDGRFEESLVLYRASTAAESSSPDGSIGAGIVLSQLRRCDEARIELHEAERRFALLTERAPYEEEISSLRASVVDCVSSQGPSGPR